MNPADFTHVIFNANKALAHRCACDACHAYQQETQRDPR